MTEDIKNLGALKELAALKKENPEQYNETINGMKGVMKDLNEEAPADPAPAEPASTETPAEGTPETHDDKEE